MSRRLTTKTSAEVYVTSFSALGDDLSQWRAYGTSLSERYAIGFGASALIGLTIAHPTAMYAKVLYHATQQRDRVNSLIWKAIDLVQQEPTAALNTDKYAIVTAMHIARLLPILKDSAYEREAEWRLVIWYQETDTPLEIDTSRGILRPYVLFELGEPVPVVALNIMAPTRRDATLKATNMLLKATDIRNVIPRHSQIPFAD